MGHVALFGLYSWTRTTSAATPHNCGRQHRSATRTSNRRHSVRMFIVIIAMHIFHFNGRIDFVVAPAVAVCGLRV